MEQTAFNVVLSAAGAMAGFLLKALWDAVKDLQASDKDLTEKIAAVELLVRGAYVKREEFASALSRVFEKLDHIDEKVSDSVVKCARHTKGAQE